MDACHGGQTLKSENTSDLLVFIRFACLKSVKCCYIDWEMVIFVIPLLYSRRKSGTVRFATFVNLSSLCAYLREGILMFSLWRKHGRDFLLFL